MKSVATQSMMKNYLVNTPAYRMLLETRSLFQQAQILMCREQVVGSTSYCISPFKTGTTYLAGLYQRDCRVAHEPFMHPTLKNLSSIEFLKKRAALLSLDLECSGFFSGKLDVIRAVSPDAPVLYLIRSPEAWIGSVVNYFSGLNEKVTYNYVARMIFDPICGQPVDKFYQLNRDDQSELVTRLLEFWICVYEQAQSDNKTLIVPLTELDSRLEEVSGFLGLQVPENLSAWKRENAKKKDFTLSDYVDLSGYRDSIKKLGFDV